MSMEISQEDGATLRKLVPALNNIVNRICDKIEKNEMKTLIETITN